MINLGVGYGSSEKAILSAGISEDNVFGSGTNLTLQLNTSKTNRGDRAVAHRSVLDQGRHQPHDVRVLPRDRTLE